MPGPPLSGSTGERIPAERRRQQILREAIRYFSEVGLDGATRELARRIGITQPLLYRYFPTKGALLDSIFEELYVNRWDPDWSSLIADAPGPFRERLLRFYGAYTKVVLEPDWARISLFAIMAGTEAERPRAFLANIEDRLITPICIGTRAHLGLPSAEHAPITSLERELAWSLHGGIYYAAARRHVYAMAPETDMDAVIEAVIDRHLEGAGAVVRIVRAAPTVPEEDRSVRVLWSSSDGSGQASGKA